MGRIIIRVRDNYEATANQWVNDAVGAALKQYGGHDMIQRGGGAKEYLERASIKRFEEELRHVFGDWGYAGFKKIAQNSRKQLADGYGRTVRQRGRFCRSKEEGGKNEMERFKKQVYRPVYTLIKCAYENKSEISAEEYQLALEKAVLLDEKIIAGAPGIYIRGSWLEQPEKVYIGVGAGKEGILGRNQGRYHTDMKYVLDYRVFSSSFIARGIEKTIHEDIRTGDGVCAQLEPIYKDGHGWYRVKAGVDKTGYEVAQEIFHRCRNIHRGRATCET